VAASRVPRCEGDPLTWLLHVARHLPPTDLHASVVEAMRGAGARSGRVFLADHDHRLLHALDDAARQDESLEVVASAGGRAFALERTLVAESDGHTHVWLPMIDGTARIGVVRADVEGGAPGEGVVHELERVVSLAAELFVSKGHYTDAFEVVRRRKPMALEAELQRAILPPVALVTPTVSISGTVVPAYEVAGDSFDYALNGDAVDLVVIDSVGHELISSLISHLVQGSLRNSRRNGVDLAGAYQAADAALKAVFPDLRFATAAFGRLDLVSGYFRWMCAGHPPPLLVRGTTVVGEVSARPALPIGLGNGQPVMNEVHLEPGDALLLYSDGVTEGGVRSGERFGLDRLVDLLGRVLLTGLPPAEVVRRLTTAVLEHSVHVLTDDATFLLVQYHGIEDGSGWGRPPLR
jgi:serine phosphatase RsbU (regulator of sigma subunit)